MRIQSAAEILPEIANNTRADKFDCKFEDYTNKQLRKIFEDLIPNQSIYAISLLYNFLEKETLTALVQLLELNKSIAILEIENEIIHDENMALFASMLTKYDNLHYLNLRFGNLSAQGSAKLAESLTTNKGLIHLDLSYNKLSGTNVHDFCKAFENNKTINSFNLVQCNIDDEGASALLQLVKKNKNITHLDLAYNLISPLLLEDIRKGLKNNLELAEELIVEVQVNHLKNVKQLVAQGASLNYTNAKGDTALHVAAKNRHMAIARFLLAHSEQKYIKNEAGKFPLCAKNLEEFNFIGEMTFFSKVPAQSQRYIKPLHLQDVSFTFRNG